VKRTHLILLLIISVKCISQNVREANKYYAEAIAAFKANEYFKADSLYTKTIRLMPEREVFLIER